MKRFSIRHTLLSLLLAQNLFLTAGAASDTETSFQKAVELYRDGHYQQAQPLFESLHKAKPEDTKMTYYLAITMAQLSHFQQAKKLYGEIILLEPQGPAAALAKEGLKYLPKGNDSLDNPPKFDTQANTQPGGNTQNPVNAALGNYSPQDLLALQMLMQQMNGGNNNNGNNGLNMLPFLQGNGQQLDPNVMNTLMMNQLLQNFNLGGEKNNDQ